MKIYAFIFARGGSEGLPGKNIKPLGGLPLLVHSINLAKSISSISKIFVSTDCPKIAAIAEANAAIVIQRPEHLSSSTAAEWLAWQHAINHLNAKQDHFDVFVSLPTTSPLRNKEDVLECIKMLTANTDMVITVTPSSRNPFFNMVTRQENGEVNLLMTGDVHRRQDAPLTYDITTVAYVARPEYIIKTNSLFSGRVKSVIIPKERAIDIDDKWDFLLAETIYAFR